MKNLIAELLLKLAEKEEESKELVAQVEALEIILTALLRRMAKSEQEAMVASIDTALHEARSAHHVSEYDMALLDKYLDKLLKYRRQ